MLPASALGTSPHGTGTANDHVGLVLVIFGLSRADGGIEIVIIESGIDDFVAVGFKVRRLEAAYDAVPAVEEEDGHGDCVLGGITKIESIQGSESSQRTASMPASSASNPP